MKNNENRINSNKKRGMRLKNCRKMRNMTQEELSEKLNYSTNYLSMLERGERIIDWDKANAISKVLLVSPAYIMCESDIAEISNHFDIKDNDTYGNNDLLLLSFIMSMGYSIQFHIRKLYETEKPIEKKFNGKKYPIYSSLEKIVSLDRLKSFCLSNYHCIVQDNDTYYEGIIIAVTINNVRLSYGTFVFTINRLMDYIHFTFDNLKDFKLDYDNNIGGDLASECELRETPNSSLANMILKEKIAMSPTEEVTFDDGTIHNVHVIKDKSFFDFLDDDI